MTPLSASDLAVHQLYHTFLSLIVLGDEMTIKKLKSLRFEVPELLDKTDAELLSNIIWGIEEAIEERINYRSNDVY